MFPRPLACRWHAQADEANGAAAEVEGIRKADVMDEIDQWPTTPTCMTLLSSEGHDRVCVHLLLAQDFLNEGERPLTVDQVLLASIATRHLLLPHSAICKYEF